ncbi:MAG TPA: ChbG/HpnK family deacetylase, partial [Acidobacteriota bacterium]|nr:ChbG/HpnK family deacetylase [Acidobacteriota bacterium]
LAQRNPGLGVGCHLSLIGGKPVAPRAQVPHLVDSLGRCPATLSRLASKLVRGLRKEEIAREFRAQVQRIVSAGIQPTHLDTHKHTAVFRPVMDAMVETAAEFRIPCIRNPFETPELRAIAGPAARAQNTLYIKQYLLSLAARARSFRLRRLAVLYGLTMPDHFFGVALTGLLDRESIRTLFSKIPEGATEVMCHPGYFDEDLSATPTRLKAQRERELAVLTDPDLKSLAESLHIRFINYRELVSYV